MHEWSSVVLVISSVVFDTSCSIEDASGFVP